MVEMTPGLADQIAEVANLLANEDDSDAVLGRLTRLAVGLIPGATAAALTVEAEDRALTFAASDPRIDKLHDLQFGTGEGPAVEALRQNEPRSVDDISQEPRWPEFCHVAVSAGFSSCLMLPLRTDRRPAGQVSLYSQHTMAFRGASHDLAVLFAAQGGAAVRNSALYRACCQMVTDLQIALKSRAVIEQAKGILHAQFGISPEDAFRLMSRRSQDTNRKVREIAADIVRDGAGQKQFRPGP